MRSLIIIRSFLIGSILVSVSPVAANPQRLIVIANPGTPALNEQVLQRVYLGKTMEIDGSPIVPVNMTGDSSQRQAFMELVMKQGNEKYSSYWTVRHYIGKGTAPREFSTINEVIEFIKATPGAVGYVTGDVDV